MISRQESSENEAVHIMTYNKTHMAKIHFPLGKRPLTVSHTDFISLQQNDYFKTEKQGLVKSFIRRIHNLFTDKENKQHDIAVEQSTFNQLQTIDVDKETQSLNDLENCANAAREIGICGQRHTDD